MPLIVETCNVTLISTLSEWQISPQTWWKEMCAALIWFLIQEIKLIFYRYFVLFEIISIIYKLYKCRFKPWSTLPTTTDKSLNFEPYTEILLTSTVLSVKIQKITIDIQKHVHYDHRWNLIPLFIIWSIFSIMACATFPHPIYYDS